MRFARLGVPGSERPAVLTADGRAFDVTELAAPDAGGPYADDLIERVSDAMRRDALREVDASQRPGSPVTAPGKIVCVGLNYRQHAREAGMAVPAEPILFLKAADTIVGAYDTVKVPKGSSQTDYEVELGVVIGRRAAYLAADDDPLSYVFGYVAANDVSEREYQLERGGQWDKGKNCETFSPLGPHLVTRDEIPDPQTLELQSRVNGEARQSSSTADMIFPVADLVRYISQFMVLHPGDVILTGTPQGVGSGFDPPRFLSIGDTVEISVSELGTQRQHFVRHDTAEATR